MTARQLFEPRRELVCWCGWRHGWDWVDAAWEHGRTHMAGDDSYAVFHVETDGQPNDRKAGS